MVPREDLDSAANSDGGGNEYHEACEHDSLHTLALIFSVHGSIVRTTWYLRWIPAI